MPKKIDEIGNKYGRLTVLREVTKDEKRGLTGGVYWWCLCECGNTKIINGHSLRDGSTTSCGCYNKEIVSKNSKNKLIDISGNRYGDLIVLCRDVTTDDKYGTHWMCKCECGNIISVVKSSLKSGKTTSCGCKQRKIASKNLSITASNKYIDEVGNIYGKLTVIKRAERLKDDLEGVYWWCKCNCELENVIRVRGVDLRNGHTQSCGCLHSSGEYKIETLLKSNNISYKTEYIFDDLYGKSAQFPLRFDFAIFDTNSLYLIEYQGRQHYEMAEYMGGKEAFNKRIEYDKRKEEYCLMNKIPLIVIPYTQFSKLKLQDLVLDTSEFRRI